MKQSCFEMMSDREVVARLEELLREERRVTAAVLAHLGEVEARRLYLPAACPSMFVYCTRVLGMSEDQAFKRIRAARAVRRYPMVGEAVADGRVHLSGVVLLAPHLTDDNAAELVGEASGKSKVEIEVLLARRAPKADVPERLERLAEQAELAELVAAGQSDQVVVPEPGGQVAPGPARRAAKVAPLSPERFALQVTIGEATRGKLVWAQALMRHQVPSGDLAEVLDHALDALLEKVEARKFGKVKKARAAKASGSRRYVPREARRRAAARDGERCSFVGEDGRRCEEAGFLELDHVVPVAQGGEASDGVRILCRSHNQYEAERLLGREAVEAGKARRGSGGWRCQEPRRAYRSGSGSSGVAGWSLVHERDAPPRRAAPPPGGVLRDLRLQGGAPDGLPLQALRGRVPAAGSARVSRELSALRRAGLEHRRLTARRDVGRAGQRQERGRRPRPGEEVRRQRALSSRLSREDGAPAPR